MVENISSFRAHALHIVTIGALSVIFVVAASLLLALPARATPPSTMNFQGRLLDSTGAIRPDGQYNMQFRIYDAASGGTMRWNETRQGASRVQVTNGLFSVQLGEVTPLPASLFDTTNLYFEITMATPATATSTSPVWESPMTPRNKLATSAYAFKAAKAADSDKLGGLSASAFAAASGSASYIHNSTTQQAASFNVSGSGRVGGAMTINGNTTVASTTNSTTAFVVQNSSAAALLTADTTNSRVVIGSAANGVQFSANGILLTGTARGTGKLTLSPEYAGATFRGDGTNNNGTLSSDFCSGGLSINETPCSGGELTGGETSYYQWTTSQSTPQDYSIFVVFNYPDDAAPSVSGGVVDFTLEGFATNTATDSVQATLYAFYGDTCGTYSIATIAGGWKKTSMLPAFANCYLAAGDRMILEIKLTAGQGNFVRAGDIELTYRTQR